MPTGKQMWFDGNMVNYEDVKLPLLTHSLQYGSGIFEGLRAYDTEKGIAVFRLHDHMKRFLQTAEIYSMNLGYSMEELSKAIIDTVKANGSKPCYIRPFAFYNDDNIGLSAYGKKISVAIATASMDKYIKRNPGEGISCKISSWRRLSSDQLPVKAKASGNYLNSIIANSEAKSQDYDEAILLSNKGHVAEGSAENIFTVNNNILITPGTDSDILNGITRDSIMKISENVGLEVSERGLHREELYTSDEVFLAGTAAEITPVSKVDNVKIGNGLEGPITKMLSDKYSSIVHGKEPEFEEWLSYI